MSTLETMYAPQANSPMTTTTGAMTTGSLTVDVLDASILPNAPMLLVLGGESEDAETILVSSITSNTLTISQRAVEGNAKAWPEGTTVARLFTAKDLADVQTNISILDSDKLEASGDGSSVTAAFTTAGSKADINSGESLATIFGKIKKWYASFGSLAWLSSLSKSDVGLGNVDNVQQYSSTNPPPYPVTSVNGSTGSVTVTVPSASTSTPEMDGTGAAGSSTNYARADHVHPSDTAKAEAKVFSNKTVSTGAWTSDATYAAYPYAADITTTGVTSSMIPEVVFAVDDAIGGNFAPVANTGTDKVTIYAAATPSATITIPSIICIKG